MVVKATAEDSGEESSLNEEASSVTAVEVTADDSRGLLRSCMIESETIQTLGTATVLLLLRL